MFLLGLAAIELVLSIAGLYPGSPPYVTLSGKGDLLTVHLHGRSRNENKVAVTAMPESEARRVVMVGDSTIYGLHLRPESTIAMFLEQQLEERTGGSWEVINLGASGFSAEMVRAVAELAVEELNPEFLVVYTGHNEFLLKHPHPFLDRVQHPVLSRMIQPLGSLRLGRALHSALIDSKRTDYASLVLGHENTLLERSAIAPSRTLVLENYENQITEIVEAADESGVKLVLVEPTSNGREYGPVASAFSKVLDADARARYEEDLAAAALHLNEGESEAGATILDALGTIDPNVGELIHQRAAVAWSEGETTVARRLDLLAFCWDEYAVVSSEDILSRLRAVAGQYGQELTLVAPFMERIPAQGELSIFIDCVHPTAYGQFLMARVLAVSIESHGGVYPEPFPGDLQQRQLGFGKSCKVLGIRRGFAEASEWKRILGFAGRSAIALVPGPYMERARVQLNTLGDRAHERSELIEPLLVLALLDRDAEQIIAHEQRLKAWSVARHERMMMGIQSHVRLRACLEEAGLHIRDGAFFPRSGTDPE